MRAGPTHAGDFYSWSLHQARLVREGRWDEIDRDNVAEEIESLGRAQFCKLEAAVHTLLLNMLQWEYQRNVRSRRLVLSIELQRLKLEDILADNPGLQPRIEEAIARAYRRAGIQTAVENGLDESVFPETCPYSLDDITTRSYSLDG
jgi:Domain of unknown function DUF29